MAVLPHQHDYAASTTRAIASGDGGTFQTLDAMARLAHGATADAMVVDVARQLVAARTAFQSRTQYAQAVGIRNFLLSAWRFADDPSNRELLRTPDTMLAEYGARGYIAGDCDEAATLGAALGMAVGIRARYVVLEIDDGLGPGFGHVFAVLLPNDGPGVTLDITRPPKGSPVPAVTRWAYMDV